MLEVRQTIEFDEVADLPPSDAGHDAGPAGKVFPETVDLELPGWIWGTMFACYATFLAGLVAATGHSGEAIFVLAISIGYFGMFFGTAGILFGVSRPAMPSAFARGLAPLQTWTGPMDTKTVAAQVLTVPACLAFFGVAAAIIRVAMIG